MIVAIDYCSFMIKLEKLLNLIEFKRKNQLL